MAVILGQTEHGKEITVYTLSEVLGAKFIDIRQFEKTEGGLVPYAQGVTIALHHWQDFHKETERSYQKGRTFREHLDRINKKLTQQKLIPSGDSHLE